MLNNALKHTNTSLINTLTEHFQYGNNSHDAKRLNCTIKHWLRAFYSTDYCAHLGQIQKQLNVINIIKNKIRYKVV